MSTAFSSSDLTPPHHDAPMPLVASDETMGGAFGARFERAFRTATSEEGVLGAALDHHFGSRGKRHRAQLALDAAAALGLSEGVATSFAVACELLHNASLVHDDLQDRDQHRRGRPTVWSLFGDDVAINVGDFLLCRAFETAAEAPISPQHALDVVGAFSRATTAVIRGQIADNDYARAPRIDLAYFESIARSKTGPLLALPVQAAVAARGLAPLHRGVVAGAFEALAVAFQTSNDVADLLDRDARAAGSDLRAGRPNVVVGLHTRLIDDRFLARVDAARALLLTHPDQLDQLVSEVASSPAVEEAFRLVDRAIERARETASRLPEALQPIFESTARRISDPIDALRVRREHAENAHEVLVEACSASTPIPVQL
ncbi:MAG: polyprenyl synthetase family protein [Myxococcota bacterium]